MAAAVSLKPRTRFSSSTATMPSPGGTTQASAIWQTMTPALASGALISAVVGFAARDSIGNAISGISLAVTQPIRVGDLIAIGDVHGSVEDVTLTATGQIMGGPDDGRTIHAAYELTKGKTIHFGPHVAIALSEIADRVAILAIFALPNMEITTVQHPG